MYSSRHSQAIQHRMPSVHDGRCRYSRQVEQLIRAQSENFDDLTIEPIQRPRLLGPVLRYVLMQVELQMRTDSPMLLVLDDAAIPWAVSRIEEKSKEYGIQLTEASE